MATAGAETSKWPELTNQEIARLVSEFRLSKEVQQIHGEPENIKRMLGALLARLHGAPLHLKGDPTKQPKDLNPAAMPRCQPDKKSDEAFKFTAFDPKDLQKLESGTAGTYLQYRSDMADLIHEYHGTGKSSIIVQDHDQTHTVVMKLHNMRIVAEGKYLVEAQFACFTFDEMVSRNGLNTGCVKALKDIGLLGSGVSRHTFNTSEIKLLREVLSVNSSRLAPEFEQHCKHEWGLCEDSPFAVSVLVPASHPYEMANADEWKGAKNALMGQCAVCGQPAAFNCSKCQMVRYCCREHQKANWRDHKPMCKIATSYLNEHGMSLLKLARYACENAHGLRT